MNRLMILGSGREVRITGGSEPTHGLLQVKICVAIKRRPQCSPLISARGLRHLPLACLAVSVSNPAGGDIGLSTLDVFAPG
jgi:hypothetical protein